MHNNQEKVLKSNYMVYLDFKMHYEIQIDSLLNSIKIQVNYKKYEKKNENFVRLSLKLLLK